MTWRPERIAERKSGDLLVLHRLFVPQSGMAGRLNKNAYSAFDLSARRSAQMGI